MTHSMYKKVNKKTIANVLSILCWIGLWQFASVAIGQEILLVSPATVIIKLFQLALFKEFWYAVLFSFGKILSGFLLASFFGCILAYLASKSDVIKAFINPPMYVIKATPVASFIILALLWIKSANLSVFISFIMVLPIIYNNVLKGITEIDVKMIEMAKVFKMKYTIKFLYIDLFYVMPYFVSACNSALSMCFKAGIAAEVIATPNGSIGEMLYKAKIFLNTPELFAWTLTIILLSFFFEKFFIFIINKVSLIITREN